MPSAWGHTRLLETDWRLITQESHCFSCGSLKLVMTKKDNGASAGSVLGIVTSCIAWIPLLGWIMHLLSAILLIIGAVTKDKVENA